MQQFDYSNLKKNKPKKIPLLRILLIALIIFGIYNYFSDESPVKVIKKQIQKKIAVKKKPKKKPPHKKSNRPILLIDSTYSVKSEKRNNGTHAITFTFVEKKPLVSDSTKLLSSTMVSIINRALIQNKHSRTPLSLTFYTTAQKALYYFSIKSGKTNEDFALFKSDSTHTWINKDGCVFDRPCFNYPGRVELLKLNNQNLVNFKGPTNTTIKSIHSGTVHSVDRAFTNGALIKIHHGNNLYSYYTGIDSTTIKVNTGDHVGSGTTLAKITEKAPSFFLTMEKNNKPTSFPEEWRKSYPIRSSTTLKEFVASHF